MEEADLGDQPLKFDPDVVDFVLEFGPGICLSVEECRATLSTVGTKKITPAAVARIMSGMLKTEEGAWNGKVFVQAVLDLVPTFIWKEVFHQLDFPGFGLRSLGAFRALVEALRHGLTLQGQTRPDQFPVEAFYRVWNNSDAQMSLIRHALNPANHDVFCFADLPSHSASVDILKAPSSQDKAQEVKETLSWRSLELVELLLRLSDVGHYAAALDLFQFPVTHCPDVLVLALTQLSSPMNLLRQELLSTLFPLFLSTHASSGPILQFAWLHAGSSAVRPVLIQAMADWYLRSDFDQARLSRILDIAQDLKALPLLLNAPPHAFVIDLASLASRREFLKLDKWLGDKVREFGEAFVSSLVKVVGRRAPHLVGKDDSLQSKSHFPPEVLGTVVNALHQAIGKSTSHELGEAILGIANNYALLLSKQRHTPQTGPLGNVVRAQRNVDPTFRLASPPPQSFPADALSALGPTLAGLNLAGLSSGIHQAFSLNALGTTPASPSRLLGHSFTNAQHNAAFGGLPPQLPRNASTPPIPLPPGNTPLGNPLLGMLSARLPNQPSPQTPFTRAPLDNAAPPPPTFTDIQGSEISKEAEDEANGYFHRIYSKPPDPTMSIEEVLELLKRFQDSSNRREREVFACMLRNLFEEYKFFPQYPEKELHTTAQLFGGIIEHGLVSSFVQLGIALRFVVDALKKPIGSKMYYFGIAALDRFKAKLKDYPQYCQHLKAIPHFYEFPAPLADYVEFGVSQREPPALRTRPGASSLPPAQTHGQKSLLGPQGPQPSPASAPGQGKPAGSVSATSLVLSQCKGIRPSIATSTNISTLLVATEKEEAVGGKAPSELVQDKTAFIFNNLNQMNLGEKCRELKELLQTEHWLWMSQYLVMKRASIELNFHTLYANLLDTIKENELNEAVVQETHRNIRILLRADKSASNFSDRSLLKNLGHWLGMITLMKNKPIILDDLDIKSLLVEAFRKGLQDLLYVVPFAAKIMEASAKSLVFRPPSPWTMAILNLLAELHAEPDIKLNLKFEIEVLCKALGIDIADLHPTALLKDDQAFKVLVRQLSYAHRPLEPDKIRPPDPSAHAFTPLPHPPLPTAHAKQRDTPEAKAAAPTPPPPPPLHTPATLLQTQSIGGPLLSGLATISSGVAQEPKFSFQEVDTGNLGALLSHVCVNAEVALFQTHPALKAFVKPALEKGISDLIHPVVDRSVKYTVNACEAVVKKDFAMDPEENRMRAGAHQMMRHLAAGMAMITSRDHIFIAISGNLRSAFTAALRQTTNNADQMKDVVEDAVNVLAQENMELACVFIQKTAVEKALVEIDKRLAGEYEVRKQAKQEGRRYCDPVMLAYQIDRLPESIRVKPSSLRQSQEQSVYEDFSRNIPGFLPPSNEAFVRSKRPEEIPCLHTAPPLPPPAANDDLLTIYDKLMAQMDNYLQELGLSPSALANQLSNGVRILGELILRAKTSRCVVSTITLLQKSVEGLLEGLASFPTDAEIIRFRDAHLLVLKALQDPKAFGESWVSRQVTKTLIESRSDLKFNVEAVDTLIRSNLVNMLQFDAYLANALEKGSNLPAMNFAIPLVRMYCVDERFSVAVNEGDFFHTADILCRCASMNRQHPEGLLSLVEALRGTAPAAQPQPNTQPSAAETLLPSQLHTGMSQSGEFDDPSGLVEKSELLLRDWIRLFLSTGTPRDSSKAFGTFMNELTVSGILKSDDVITRFFRISVQGCVNQVYQGLQTGGFAFARGKVYQSTDALVRLVSLLIRHIGVTGNPDPKVSLLQRFLGIVAGLLIQDHDMQKTDFQQLPFHRLFIMFFYDMVGPDPVLESIAMQTLSGFSNTLHILNPTKVPGFAYAWLEIVGNRVFIGRMLALASDQKCWAMYCQLLLDLFKFLQPFMRNADMPSPVQTLYRGTLRVLLVILHDFPDFLCDYSYHFLDAIPPNCIQMRNLILSAFPRNMRLPDPFTANLKFEMLADTAMAPRILSNVGAMITPPAFRDDMDSYLKTRAPVTFLSELRTNLQVEELKEEGNRYNIPLINALVLYVGSQHIAGIRGRGQTPSLSTVAHTSHMDIFQNLAVDLDTEGRYLFLNALANQLRFPSSHTHYFSLIILYLFAESNTEVVQEQITRVLLERLVVNRPHPWGLLVTFIELIKNPVYKFWTHEFVHCAPEVEKLFESVARSCMVTKAPAMPSPPQSHQPMSALHLGPTTNGPSLLNFNSSADSSLDQD